MTSRDRAVASLLYFFALALGKDRVDELPLHYRIEIAEIVDAIIDAAKEDE